jgi:hypothetical protein
MVKIEYEVTIYIYKEFFPLGDSSPNPRYPPARGIRPPTWRGVQYSWGINMVENKDL